jgi:hypothetical protein
VPTLALVVGLTQIDAQATSLAAMIRGLSAWQQHWAGNALEGGHRGRPPRSSVWLRRCPGRPSTRPLRKQRPSCFVAAQFLWSTQRDLCSPPPRADILMVRNRVVHAAFVA